MGMEFVPGATPVSSSEGNERDADSVAEAFARLQQKIEQQKGQGDPLENPAVVQEAAEALRKEEARLAQHPPKIIGA